MIFSLEIKNMADFSWYGQLSSQRLSFKIMAIYQIRPNQSSPSGMLHFVQYSLRAYQKNFSSLGPMGAEMWGPKSSKFEKQQ